MWAGDVQSDYPNSNWALNPSAYQNLPNEQVDWATLAQQWIKMKDTLPVDQVPAAPPPPSIKADIEAGEAPMDMSKDEASPSRNANVSSQDSSGNWNNWSSWQQWNSWGWGDSANTAGDKGAGVPPYTYSTSTGNTEYSADVTLPAAATFDYNHGAAVPDNYNQQNYWSAGGPGPYMRNKSTDWRGGKHASGRSRHSTKPEEAEMDTTPVLDAAKRKQLPAWIREGLEKMEREKQRKMERDRQMMERERQLQQQKEEEEAALASGIPVKSKFETDSEESEAEKEPEESTVKPRRSRFDSTTPTPTPVTPKPAPKSFSPPPVQHKTKEEIMQDVVQQMRYVLTDILMKVTNEEMHRVAEEVLSEMRAKAPATQLRKTPALTSLTGKLGLGIYDSDSNDDSDQGEDEPVNGVDSDEELRERIMRKKQEFSRIERDIEQMVELQEEKEREREHVKEQTESESESEETKFQVETSASQTGVRTGIKVEEQRIQEIKIELPTYEREGQTPEKSQKSEHFPSETQTEDSDNSSSSKSESSSRSSSSSRRRKSKKSKKKNDRKSSKRKRKRSLSRSSDRRKSHRKSGRYEERDRRSRSRSRSRSRERDHYRRHSTESSRSHKRRHRSYSRDYSPDYHYRGKKSSHRSRD